MKYLSYHIFLRTKAPKKNGAIPVYMRIIIKREHKDYSLGVAVSEPDKFWDPSENRVKRCSWINRQEINKTIEDSEDKARDILKAMKDGKVLLNLNEFNRHWTNQLTSQESFYAFAENEISSLVDRKAAPDTIRSYKSYISKMKRFKPELSFSEITLDLIKEYDKTMIRLGNQDNTRHKALAWMRTIIKRAQRDGLIQFNPFQYYTLKRKPGCRDYLSIPELNRLEIILAEEIVIGRQANALKCFLFSVYTGLRFSDLRNLRFSDIKEEPINGTTGWMIRMNMQKTDRAVSIPLLPQAIALLPVNPFKEQKVLQVPCNQVTNRHLKRLAEMTGIRKRLTFHVARHSFATISMTIGMKIEIVSKLLGHTDLKTTQIYAKIIDDVKVNEMKRWKDV